MKICIKRVVDGENIMHPTVHAKQPPDNPAVIMAGSGLAFTYKELDQASNRLAHFFRHQDINIGDTVAILMENHPHYFDVTWAAQRSGLCYVCISNRLTPDEASYILSDSGAKMLISSAAMRKTCDALLSLNPDVTQFLYDSDDRGIEDHITDMPNTPIDDERRGVDMLYSSGTTGRPKGVRIPLPEDDNIAGVNLLAVLAMQVFGLSADSIYLSPAPLYHAAPLRWCMSVHSIGGTAVIMEKFDPELVLQAIEKYHVTDSQWVPTHFVRMLKLPDAVREQYDLSSLKGAVHAAAPCPIPIKKAMIKWWGPILHEYYAGSEGNGMTYINSEDWLSHEGSVGKPILGTPRICDEDGEEITTGEEGQIYFEGGTVFSYHNDPKKTAEAANDKGWTSLGDVGKIDEDGFLYLTDRKSFMIISGGVNIYPQEIENHLITHSKVQDVAVIGGPHDDMGEEVIAVVQPVDMSDANDDLRSELDAYAREKLSGVKIPRRIDFRDQLPRHDTGKLYKRLLRDEYWNKA